MQEIRHNTGIEGFVKGHRHPSGPVLVMTSTEDSISVFWMKRLSRKSVRVHEHEFRRLNVRTEWAAARTYDIMMGHGPPDAARCDVQRERVYAWEEDHIFPGQRKLTWGGCERFTDAVWTEVGEGPLYLTNTRRFLCAISLAGTIHLPPRNDQGEDGYYWRKPIILHEIAHELTPQNQHGPKFVTTYIDLCEWFLGYDRASLEAAAQAFDIEFY